MTLIEMIGYVIVGFSLSVWSCYELSRPYRGEHKPRQGVVDYRSRMIYKKGSSNLWNWTVWPANEDEPHLDHCSGFAVWLWSARWGVRWKVRTLRHRSRRELRMEEKMNNTPAIYQEHRS
jgi:hypothetical protein